MDSIMKVKLKREENFTDSKFTTVEINGCRYRLSESIDGRLKVNKISIDGTDDYIRIHPVSGNEIDLS